MSLLMLSLIGCTACTQQGETGETGDTGAQDQGVIFDQNQPGPYDQICDEDKVASIFAESRESVWSAEWLSGPNWFLFNHAAQVLQAKLEAYALPGDYVPDLPEVCEDLAWALSGSIPGPMPIIGDCPNLIPDTQADVQQFIPAPLQGYYDYAGAGQVASVTYPNIAYEHPNFVDSHPLPAAMNEVELFNGNPPGCWCKFDLVGDAAAGDLTMNSMPVVLFTNHAYLTAAVMGSTNPEESLVISGATFTIPSPVAGFLAGGNPPPSPAPMPYAELYLSAGYPPDANMVLNLDQIDYSVMELPSMNAPADSIPPLLGWGIMDPETEQDLREIDWAIHEHRSITWDVDDSNLILDYDEAFDVKPRGFGMPKLWPAVEDTI